MYQIKRNALIESKTENNLNSTESENDAESKLSLAECIKQKKSKLKRLKKNYEYEKKRKKEIKKKLANGRKDYKKIIKNVEKIEKKLAHYQTKKTVLLKALRKQKRIHNLVVSKRLERFKMMGEYKKFYRRLYEKEKNELHQKRQNRKNAPKYVNPQVRYIKKLIKNTNKTKSKLLESLEYARNNLGTLLVQSKTSNLKNISERIKAVKAKVHSLKAAHKKQIKEKRSYKKKKGKSLPRSISEVRLLKKQALKKRQRDKKAKRLLKLEDLYYSNVEKFDKSNSDLMFFDKTYDNNLMTVNPYGNVTNSDNAPAFMYNTGLEPSPKNNKIMVLKKQISANTAKIASGLNKKEKAKKLMTKATKTIDNHLPSRKPIAPKLKDNKLVKTEKSIDIHLKKEKIEELNRSKEIAAGKKPITTLERKLKTVEEVSQNQKSQEIKNSQDKVDAAADVIPDREIIGDGGDTCENMPEQTTDSNKDKALSTKKDSDLGDVVNGKSEKEKIEFEIGDVLAKYDRGHQVPVGRKRRMRGGSQFVWNFEGKQPSTAQDAFVNPWSVVNESQRDQAQDIGDPNKPRNFLSQSTPKTELLYMNSMPGNNGLTIWKTIGQKVEECGKNSISRNSPFNRGRLQTLGISDESSIIEEEKRKRFQENAAAIREANNERVMANAVLHLLNDNLCEANLSINSRNKLIRKQRYALRKQKVVQYPNMNGWPLQNNAVEYFPYISSDMTGTGGHTAFYQNSISYPLMYQ